MKIAGKIIRECNIKRNDEHCFEAFYKHHNVVVFKYCRYKNNEYEYQIEIQSIKGIFLMFQSIRKSNIREAITYALEESGI